MGLTVTRYGSAAAFLDAVEPYLLRQEALNGLILGTAHALRRQSPRRCRSARQPNERRAAAQRGRGRSSPGLISGNRTIG